MSINWGDHYEHRVVLGHDPLCSGPPQHKSGTDQSAFCLGGCVTFSDQPGGEPYFHLPAGKLAEFAGTLYAARGLPAPVILDRPAPRDVLVPGPHGGDDVAVTPSPAGHPGNLPGVSLRIGCEPDGYAAIRLIGDEPLRVAVALIDAMREAEQAPDEPDPREVAGLARALHRTHCVPNGCCTEEPSAGDLDEARTALRWMQDKQREAAK